MFESFVLGKIQKENNLINDSWDSILSGEVDLKAWVVKSNLSDFTKNYILNDFEEKIDKDELQAKVDKSNKLYFNYALRPKWTLLTFLFNNFESRPPNEIIKKLNLFPFYNFYTDAITTFIKSNFQIFSTKVEITNIIDEANKAIHQKLTEDINNAKIKNFFLQVFKLKYDEESNYNLESTIPYSFIRIFLDDKSFTDFKKKFTVMNSLKEDSEISLKDILKILADKYNTPDKDDNIKIKAEPDEKEPLIKAPPEIPLLKTEIKKDEPVKKLTEEKIEEPKPKKIYSEQLIKENEKKKLQENNTAIKPLITTAYGVKDLFNEKQLEKISDKIYNSDLIYRDKSFNKLNNYKTWFEASNHLKEIFKINEVDIYNKDVISFIDILNDYYKNRE